MLTVSELYIYPIKSLGGIGVKQAMLGERGFVNDRRLMLVDDQHRFLTQREHHQMALLQVSLNADGFTISHKQNKYSPLTLRPYPGGGDAVRVTIWDDVCDAILFDDNVNQWFSEALGLSCKLVYMPDSSRRLVDPKYAKDQEITSFSDAYPILIIGQSSLDDLNRRLEEKVPMNRFRPNIVFTGGIAYEEDEFDDFLIGQQAFKAVKPCARCVMTTIKQDDATSSKEPLKTLAGYRSVNNKVLFGQNLLHYGAGRIAVGDALKKQA